MANVWLAAVNRCDSITHDRSRQHVPCADCVNFIANAQIRQVQETFQRLTTPDAFDALLAASEEKHALKQQIDAAHASAVRMRQYIESEIAPPVWLEAHGYFRCPMCTKTSATVEGLVHEESCVTREQLALLDSDVGKSLKVALDAIDSAVAEMPIDATSELWSPYVVIRETLGQIYRRQQIPSAPAAEQLECVHCHLPGATREVAGLGPAHLFCASNVQVAPVNGTCWWCDRFGLSLCQIAPMWQGRSPMIICRQCAALVALVLSKITPADMRRLGFVPTGTPPLEPKSRHKIFSGTPSSQGGGNG